MFKSFIFDEQIVELVANAATPIRFNQVFNEDLVKFFIDVERNEAVNTSSMISKAAYIMHLQAEGADFNKVNEETFIEWLEGFSPNAIMLNANEIMTFYYSNQNQIRSTSKKKSKTQTEK